MGEAPVSAQDVRAAAEVHAELGPDYGDAVVESFLAKLDKQIEARVEERLASIPARRWRPAGAARRRPVDPVRLSKRRYALAGGVGGAVVAGLPLTLIAVAALSESYRNPGVVLVAWVPVVIIIGLAAYWLRRRR
jgi:hypothetical protein